MNLSKIKENANLRLSLVTSQPGSTAIAAGFGTKPKFTREERKAITALKKFGLTERDWGPLWDVSFRMYRKPGAFEVAEWITGKPLSEHRPNYKPGRAAKLCEESYQHEMRYYEGIYDSPTSRGKKLPKGAIEKACFVDANGKPHKPTVFEKLLFLGFAPLSYDFYKKNGVKNPNSLSINLGYFGVEFPNSFENNRWYYQCA